MKNMFKKLALAVLAAALVFGAADVDLSAGLEWISPTWTSKGAVSRSCCKLRNATGRAKKQLEARERRPAARKSS